MRQNALRRTRAMQKQNMHEIDVQAKSCDYPREHRTAISNPLTEKSNQKKDCSRAVQSSDNNKKQSNNLNSIFSSLFSNGKPDNDKILIIALIIILAKEGADVKLLLALGYILM